MLPLFAQIYIILDDASAALSAGSLISPETELLPFKQIGILQSDHEVSVERLHPAGRGRRGDVTGETVRLKADGVGVHQQDGEIAFFFHLSRFFHPHKHQLDFIKSCLKPTQT